MKADACDAIKKNIFKEREEKASFSELIASFDKDWAWLTGKNNLVDINDFFGRGIGTKGSYELLKKQRGDLFRGATEDFKGIYVFFSTGKPFYAGISQNVIYRIHQHVKQKSHFSASMAFNIGKDLLQLQDINVGPAGDRKTLEKQVDWVIVQDFLMKQQINFLPINSDDQLALFEMYCTIEGGMAMNTFKTH